MLHAVWLVRDTWVRFNTPSVGSRSPRLSDNRIFGELELSHHTQVGASAYTTGPLASDGGYGCQLCYDGAVSVTPPDEPQFFAAQHGPQ